MKAAAKLATVLFAFALVPVSSAQQTQVVINLTQQTAYLLEGGQVAFVSPIASGKEGWGTPTGNFRIINKDLSHRSADFGLVVDTYGRIVNPNATPGSYVPRGCHYEPAPMPYYMQFGKYLGMHGGYLPGYPASHGCVRMPSDLAAEFFARVHIGTPVEVVGNARNVTRVRRAIPLVQPGDAMYATSFFNARSARREPRPQRIHASIPILGLFRVASPPWGR
jgi:lipoprotein-anchoring transpeptidase ErfK/SrfK